MLKIIRSMKDLDFGLLMDVYEESNRASGRKYHSHLSENQQLMQAEQDHYGFLRQFFRDGKSFYAVWAPGGRYKAALRIDPYRDGLLLEGLETAPAARGQGNATALVKVVLTYLEEQDCLPVYSHVHKKNMASLALHKSAGFQIIKDHAIFLDGSVSNDAYTLCYRK